MKRIDTLKQRALKEFDGFLVFRNANLTYFTGFSGASALLIPENGENIVYVYGVNYEQAKAELTEFRVELVERSENLMGKIAKQAKAFKIKKLAVDALNIESWRSLSKSLGGEKCLRLTVASFGSSAKLRTSKKSS